MSLINRQVTKRMKARNRKSKYVMFHGVRVRKWTYPIGVLIVLWEERRDHKIDSWEWNEKKAEKMANKYFGKICDVDEEDGSLWFCTEWSVGIWACHASCLDYDWLRKFGKNMHAYIVDTFTIKGYDKSVQMTDMVNTPYVEWVHFIKTR